MEGKSFKMVSYRLPLKKKKFGIYEAGNTIRNIKKIDIAVVPVVGVDGRLQRVGFGKGMYDRFFEKLEKKMYSINVKDKSLIFNTDLAETLELYNLMAQSKVTLYSALKVLCFYFLFFFGPTCPGLKLCFSTSPIANLISALS